MDMNQLRQIGQSKTYSVPGVRRVQPYAIYDKVNYTGSSGTVKAFVEIAGKDSHETNLQQPGMLPFREEFDAIAISLVPDFGTAAADMNGFYSGCAIEFEINGKPVWKVPTCLHTAGCGLEGVSGFAGTAVAAGASGEYHNGLASPMAILKWMEPFHLGKGEQFGVKLITDTALSPSITAFDVLIVIHGYIRTLVQ